MKFKQANQICSPLTNQSTLNKAHVIEITKAHTIAFMKSRNSLLVQYSEKKKEYGVNLFLNSIQEVGTTSISPVTSTNIGISPKNFLTFTYNTFVTLAQNLKAISNTSPKVLNFNQDNPSKKVSFLVKSL